MKLIPAMSIKHGRVAVVEDGAYIYPRNEDGQFRSPVNILKEAGFPGDEVFILDLDGLENNSPDLDVVKRIAPHKEVWLDAGTVDSESMMDLFVSDVSKVVMGTLSLESLGELGKALEMSENVIFSVAYDGGVLSPDPQISGIKPDDLLARIRDLSIAEGMLFDLGSIRRRCGIDMDAVSRIAGRFDRFYVSGHVTEEDLKTLEDAGVSGAIIDFRTLEAVLRGRT